MSILNYLLGNYSPEITVKVRKHESEPDEYQVVYEGFAGVVPTVTVEEVNQ